MSVRRKPINGIIILIIVATAILYSDYRSENQFWNRQIQVFGHISEDSSQDASINTSPSSGFIQPQVVDGYTEQPIEGAMVVIPEIDGSYRTNEQGYTPNIPIPVTADEHFENIHPKTWGETTLIVYKEGYIEYVLFHINVWESQNRQGPKVLLFPQKSKQLDQPMSIVEGPHQLWVNSLVEKYRP
ncbi:MAG TPA: hypothetical protein VFD57_03105 [Clostridia bacterium]|nr:hypothetical protein [Clostridia bacterium]